jgi:hypothetical protein
MEAVITRRPKPAPSLIATMTDYRKNAWLVIFESTGGEEAGSTHEAPNPCASPCSTRC